MAEAQPQNKRKAVAAGLPGAPRPVKRRASKACCCCRARKVRCDVVENGSPCTNCRLDEVECVVTESKRRKKNKPEGDGNKASPESPAEISDDMGFLFGSKSNLPGAECMAIPEANMPLSPVQNGMDFECGQHVPHLIYQTQARRFQGDGHRRISTTSIAAPTPSSHNSMSTRLDLLTPTPGRHNLLGGTLPNYLRPLPPKFQTADIEYLEAKGALSIPEPGFRNELLRSYMKWVHSYMPLLDLDDFLGPIFRNDGSRPLSLLLFQAVMFAGTAFIDMKHLQAAGFESRKAARKSFFQKARLLYDFDYELDRISLVQSLLLMTYWYEMPDDQKDTWHWMGVSLSLAHTIGLHRNPANSTMTPQRQKLWKRIWWSTYTRDRLIALGMRRPTRIKDEDCDVPMLDINDFDCKPLSSDVLRALGDVEMTHNTTHQRELAAMFIQKSKLCLCISHILSAQYSVLGHKFGGTMETTMMLLPKKSAAEPCEVRRCDDELDIWLANLPKEARYRPPVSALSSGHEVIHLHRALLQMIYLTTLSALHRPHVLPATPFPTVEVELQALSRNKVRQAAAEITNISQVLHNFNLTRYLPTTGVTVLLPAVIIHLLDIKSNDISVRAASLERFYRCMQILQRLREIYASADFATSFLEAAIRKAGVNISPQMFPTNSTKLTTVTPTPAHLEAFTPPPEAPAETPAETTIPNDPVLSLPTLTRASETEPLFASTPPCSVGSENGSTQNIRNDDIFKMDLFETSHNEPEPTLTELMDMGHDADITQNDLDALINFDAGADVFPAENGPGHDFSMSGNFLNDSGMGMDNLNWIRELAGNGNLSTDSGFDMNESSIEMGDFEVNDGDQTIGQEGKGEATLPAKDPEHSSSLSSTEAGDTA